MHAVPEGFDLSPFVDHQLNQICIGPHDLQFRFEGIGHFLCTGGQVWIEIGGVERLVFDGLGWHDVTPLPSIVGENSTAWSLRGTHSFSLSIGDNAVIRFQSEDSPYEDFVVSTAEGVWVM